MFEQAAFLLFTWKEWDLIMEQTFEPVEQMIDFHFDKCRKAADYLTDHPETGGEEEGSCEYLVSFLRSQGYEVQTPYAGMPHSFLAVPEAKKQVTKRAVFLCEYDALPEVGHACGHSVSCGASILAGLAINEACKDLPIRIDIMGTPAEENLGGKVIIAENGGFDGYTYAAMVHMNNENSTYFRVLASNDRYITFHGKASHASAAPESGLNALNGARLFMDAMDMWRQHIPKDCQFHGIVAEGGEAPNIVPDKVVLDYYFRAATMENLAMVNEKARICAEGAALATGTTVTMEQRYPDYGEIFSNEYRDTFMKQIFEKADRKSAAPEEPKGSSDGGNVDMRIPIFHPMIDITNGRKEIVLHDRAFAALLKTAEAYRGMKDGARILCRIVYELAMNPEVEAQILKDHKAYRRAR